MRQPAQHLVSAIFQYDCLSDHRAEPRHAIAQPFGHVAAVQRQVRTARSANHQPAPVGTLCAPSALNSGSSVVEPIGV